MMLTMAEAGLTGALSALLMAILIVWYEQKRQEPMRAIWICLACTALTLQYYSLADQTGARQVVLLALLGIWTLSLAAERQVSQLSSKRYKLQRLVSTTMTIFLGSAPFFIVVFDRLPLRFNLYTAAALSLCLIGFGVKIHSYRHRQSAWLANTVILYGFFIYACESPSGWLTLLGPLLLQTELKQGFLRLSSHSGSPSGSSPGACIDSEQSTV